MENKTIRKNTLKIIINKGQDKPSAMEIHAWIDKTLQITPDQVQVLQLVGRENAIYIKLVNNKCFETLLKQYRGSSELTISNGSKLTVNITAADEDHVQLRVFDLPPELSNEKIRCTLQTYGEITEIINEKWSTGYKYQVESGIRTIKMFLKKPVPTNLKITGHDAYITYPGQKVSKDTTQLKNECPNQTPRQSVQVEPLRKPPVSDVLLKEEVIEKRQSSSPNLTPEVNSEETEQTQGKNSNHLKYECPKICLNKQEQPEKKKLMSDLFKPNHNLQISKIKTEEQKLTSNINNEDQQPLFQHSIFEEQQQNKQHLQQSQQRKLELQHNLKETKQQQEKSTPNMKEEENSITKQMKPTKIKINEEEGENSDVITVSLKNLGLHKQPNSNCKKSQGKLQSTNWADDMASDN